MMELKFVNEKSIIGLTIRTNNANEMTTNQGKIPALWQRFDQSIPVDYKNGERVYGVYFNYSSDHNDDFSVLAGFDGNSVPENIKVEQITIPKGKYLVFSHQGVMPQIAIDAWTEVWQYFDNDNCQYQRHYSIDFEYYPNCNQIDVHIAVK